MFKPHTVSATRMASTAIVATFDSNKRPVANRLTAVATSRQASSSDVLPDELAGEEWNALATRAGRIKIDENHAKNDMRTKVREKEATI